jgi:hypothetical protein
VHHYARIVEGQQPVREMLRSTIARNNQVQIVKPLRIDLHAESREEISLFLIVSLKNNPVAADDEGFESLDDLSFGRIDFFIQGLTSSIHRRFSSRRVVQERETDSKICFAIGSILPG